MIDCLNCGACCKAFDIIQADDSIDDSLTEDFKIGYFTQLGIPAIIRVMKRKKDRSCICLSEGNRCSIYETRPRVCRDLEICGYLCRYAREKVKIGGV